MSQIHFEIVTPEKVAYQDKIDALTLDTKDGEITILPNHMPLVSVLRPGEMRIKKGNEEIFMAVSGGFVEVQPDSKVIIIADAAERAEDINELKAEEARARAQDILARKATGEEVADAEAALAHALAQLKTARRRKKRNI
ncbi:ATP synthase F1 subunit epsilon [Candidatus Azambacteria bacterium]|nr:ATP synthase F1 subunit epsilon [Candidatus Azambacteria bacterium]MBI3685134.1 ATP synthase F1 subunit epsilon [Candidatus Azambacteria bacterium]